MLANAMALEERARAIDSAFFWEFGAGRLMGAGSDMELGGIGVIQTWRIPGAADYF
jgi:hypothetical protein